MTWSLFNSPRFSPAPCWLRAWSRSRSASRWRWSSSHSASRLATPSTWTRTQAGSRSSPVLRRSCSRSWNSRPYHPQTPGKVERLHQTLKRYLAKQAPAETLDELEGQLDAFARYYNHIRPHRALAGRTPLQAYSSRVKARPAGAKPGTYFRVRED